ncbi:MAG: hypothetical protein IKQ80_07770, partial [Clostridia bacterium]|nr:hypothetical protein [Clostridia bacterium]
MKKLLALLIALTLALCALAPALAEEATEAAVEETVEAAAEDSAPEPSPIFKKLLEVPWYTWVVLAALVIAAALFIISGNRPRWNSNQLSLGAMCIAIALVL